MKYYNPPPFDTKRDDYLVLENFIRKTSCIEEKDPFIYIYISISCTSMSIHFLTIFGKFINHHHHHRKKTVVLRIQVSKRSLDRAPPKPQFSTGSEISKSSCSQRPPCEKLGHFFYTNYPKLETNMTVAPEKDGISQKGKDHLPIIHFQGHWLLVSGRVDQMMYSSWWSLLQLFSLFLTEIAHCWPRREREQDSGKSLRRTWWHSTTHSSPKPLKQFSYPFEICWVQRKGPTKSRWNFLDLFIIFHQSLKICKHYGSPPKSKTLTNLQRFDGWPLWQQKKHLPSSPSYSSKVEFWTFAKTHQTQLQLVKELSSAQAGSIHILGHYQPAFFSVWHHSHLGGGSMKFEGIRNFPEKSKPWIFHWKIIICIYALYKLEYGLKEAWDDGTCWLQSLRPRGWL